MWPFSSPYPEWSPDQVDGETYDYVIVGGKKRGIGDLQSYEG